MNLASFSVKVVATSLLIASTTGLAFAKNFKGDYNYKGEVEPCPPPPMLRDGFYVGGQVGYEAYRIHSERVYDFDVPVDTLPVAESRSLGAAGWVGGLFIGYGRYLTDVFYLGGELQANYSGAKATHTRSVDDFFADHHSIRARGTWGISLVPGLRLNNASLAYFRLGYDWTRFRFKNDFYTTPVTAPFLFASHSDSRRRGGWDLGFGVETLLCDVWSLRTEYNHIWYRNFDNTRTFVFDDGGVTGTFYTKHKPSDNQFTVGLVYHFV